MNPTPINFNGAATRAAPADFVRAAEDAGIEPATLYAVWEVECAGAPFLPDGRPAVLFEAHIFDRLTGGRFRARFPALSSPAWDRSLYASTRDGEWRRLLSAYTLAPVEALQAASWGAPQILGANYRQAGFPSVEAMVQAFCAGEADQIEAFVSFCRSKGLLVALRAKDWSRFAAGYNGTGYKANRYDEKLAAAYRHRTVGTDLGRTLGDTGDEVKRLQASLNAIMNAGLVADGVYGRMTALAIEKFQASVGLPATGRADAATMAAIAAAAHKPVTA